MNIGNEITSNPVYEPTECKLGIIYATICDDTTCTGCDGAVAVLNCREQLSRCPWCGEAKYLVRSNSIPNRLGHSRIQYHCGTMINVCITGDGYRVTAYLRSDVCLLLLRPDEDDVI